MKKLSFFLVPALAILLAACSGITEKINPHYAINPQTPTLGAGTVTTNPDPVCDYEHTGVLFWEEGYKGCNPLILIEGETPLKYRAYVDDLTAAQLTEPTQIIFSYEIADPALDEGIDPLCLDIEAIVITCLEAQN